MKLKKFYKLVAQLSVAIGYGGNVYIMKIGKCYTFSFFLES